MTNIETWRYQYANNYQGARYLLANEAQGFAIDATIHSTGEAIAAYTGGPVGGTVTVKSASDAADVLISKSLDESNLVQSGTSPKMVLWSSAPYVRWTPHNILLQSQTLGTTWSSVELSVSGNATAAPDGTMTAEKLVESGATDVHQLNQNYTTTAVVVTFSVYLKAAERTHGCLTLRTDAAQRYGAVFDLSNGTVTDTDAENGIAGTDNDIISVGGGWYRCSITILSLGANDTAQISPSNSATPTFTQSAPTYDGDGTSGLYTWGAQVNRGYTPTPYLATTTAARIGIPQEYDTAASKFGMLVEPAGTNLCLRSEDISTVDWTNTNSSESTNATTSPDGSSTADSLVEDAATGEHNVYQDFAKGASNIVYTISVFAKANTRTRIVLNGLSTDVTAGAYAWFDLSGVQLGGSPATFGAGFTAGSATITSVGDSWCRCTFSFTSDNGIDLRFKIDADNGSGTAAVSNSYAGNSSGAVYLWGAQLETGSVATSYIPTLGSTVTRARDLLDLTLTTIPSVATINAAWMQVKPLVDAANVGAVVTYKDGDEFIWLRNHDSARWRLQVDDTTNQASVPAADGYTMGTAYKLAYSATANSFNIARDGTAGTRDTSGTMPAGLTNMQFGHAEGIGGSVMGIRIYYLAVIPRAMDDTELQEKTT